MSKGKTAVCVGVFVATCITGGLLIVDSAMSGKTVGQLSDSEVFGFENQQLANAMPNFAEPIVENTEVITADTNNYIIPQMPVDDTTIADVMPEEKIPVFYTESDVTETVLTEEAVTITTVSSYDESEDDFSVVAVATTTEKTTTVAVTETTTTTVRYEQIEEESETETTTETESVHMPFIEPIEWFYVESRRTEPVEEEVTTTTN